MSKDKLVVKTVSVDSLILDPKNSKKHGRKSIDGLKRSLNAFELQKPILVSGDVVISGNGVLVAARELGWQTIDVVDVNMNPDLVKAYGIADNRSAELSFWNLDEVKQLYQNLKMSGFDVDITGFEPDFMFNGGDPEVVRHGESVPVFSIKVTTEQESTILGAVGVLTKEGYSEGDALVKICEDYLNANAG